jgi:hypothetical protein
MSPLLYDTTRRLMDTQSFEVRSTSVGLVVIVLFIALLLEHEVLRGLGTKPARAGMRALAVVVAPLLLAFSLIVGTRLAHLVL